MSEETKPAVPTVAEGKHSLEMVTYKEFLELFSDEAQPKMRALFMKPEVRAVVVFENDNEDSSEYGSKTAVKIGPTCKVKSIQAVEGTFIGDWMLGQAQVAAYYVVK
jgi:hypothetical protein